MTVGRDTALTIGGTRFELIPIAGGETGDGMFIHLPDRHVLFAGLMGGSVRLPPSVGAPSEY